MMSEFDLGTTEPVPTVDPGQNSELLHIMSTNGAGGLMVPVIEHAGGGRIAVRVP